MTTSAPITEPASAGLLYLDSSAFLGRLLIQPGHRSINQKVALREQAGASVVSSRLLWLEARRVSIRERLAGNEIEDAVEQNLAQISELPLNDRIWAGASAIEQHCKTLDALHLATCKLVGAALLTTDERMRSVALAQGIELA